MKRELKITGVVAEKDGEFFGCQYEDGHSSAYGFGPIEKAKISNPEYCLKPTDMTYRGSPYFDELKKSKLKSVTKTVIFEVAQ